MSSSRKDLGWLCRTALAAALTTLAGCGGSGNPPAPPAEPEPPQRVAELELLAGSIGGPGNLDGAASAARFDAPLGVAVRPDGTVYVSDSQNATVRQISPDGTVSTLAGTPGMKGTADGTGRAARFTLPLGIAFEPASGVLHVADDHRAVRKITAAGTVSTTTQARTSALGVDGAGNLFYAENTSFLVTGVGRCTVVKLSPAGTKADLFPSPPVCSTPDAAYGSVQGLAVDPAGNAYFQNSAALNRLRAGGSPEALLLFEGPNFSQLATDGAGHLRATYNHGVLRYSPEGTPVLLAGNPIAWDADRGRLSLWPREAGSADGTGSAARFNAPQGLAVDGHGNTYVADTGNHTIRKITPAGVVSTLAGLAARNTSADGTGSAASFAHPSGVAWDALGNAYVADTGGHAIRKITPAGVVSTWAGQAGASGSADGTGTAARFSEPRGLAFDGAGNLYVADRGNRAVRRITPAGLVTTLPARFERLTGVAAGADGTVYATEGLLQRPASESVPQPQPIRFDPSLPTLYKLSPSGEAIVLARGVFTEYAPAVDAQGNLYVSGTGPQAHTVHRITPAGVAITWAGAAAQAGSSDGTGTAARFSDPRGLAVDAAGNLHVADAGNHTVRTITPAAVVGTVAGQPGVAGVRLGPLPASLGTVTALAAGPHGLLIVSDGAVLRLRR